MQGMTEERRTETDPAGRGVAGQDRVLFSNLPFCTFHQQAKLKQQPPQS
jgi:hypothetical protein